jgi:hypothetical protein
MLRLARHRIDRGGFGDPLSSNILVRSTFDSCRGDAIERHSGCGPKGDFN